jgi:hypothetical protein
MEFGKSRDEAAELLGSVDRERAAFVRKYYDMEWPDRYLYNMMLNVGTGDGIAVETILNGMKQLDPAGLNDTAGAKPRAD